MANKSTKSPSGEERENDNQHERPQGVEASDILKNSSAQPSNPVDKSQENLQNRGYQEDQPHNPVRNNGSLKKEHESTPTGEPDTDEV
jgi:hypothetical protein